MGPGTNCLVGLFLCLRMEFLQNGSMLLARSEPVQDGHSTTVEHGSGKEHHDDHGSHPWLSLEGLGIYLGFTVAIVLLLMGSAKKGLNSRFFKKPITQYFEQLYLFLENLAVGIIGGHGRRYMPMLMVLWTVIFISNCVSLFFPSAPTADLSFNLGLALIAIGYVQWEGMRSNGILGHWSHFAGPKLAGPMVLISVMIFVIEIISEAMKNVSPSLRLYGNIDGGHRAADAMNELGAKLFSIGNGQYLGIPFGAFLLPVKLLTCVVQALIFCLLLCVYISLVTHHDEDHGHEAAHAH